ncbi:MAG: proline--tRNA ligase [Candidatus Aenigmarchaeota archaeon]
MAQKEDIAEMAVQNKKENMAEWYPEVVQKSEMADYSPIGGCIVFRPNSYEIWERIKRIFDRMIKETGHKNAYFPLFIPESLLKREADHFSGFTPEVAWIEQKEGEERFALRPTSETIIYDSYSKWIRSWRDLPLLLNQWCNIIRWETKVTKPFLRTREFLWQEGHTAHETEEDAEKEARMILNMYVDLIENYLAVPLIVGRKSESEKFAGALRTYTMESLMPDGKALQMGTSHNLGQNFAIAFNVKYFDQDMKEKHVWNTSWGISTRLIGSLIMAHGDDKGLILPPRIAPTQIVVVPIYKNDTRKDVLKASCEMLKKLDMFTVHLDDRDNYSPGWKFNEWELKGIPLRIEIGPKDIAKKQVVFVRRDTGEKEAVKLTHLEKKVEETLDAIQKNLFKRAKKFLSDNIVEATNFSDFQKAIKARKMVNAKWCGEGACEEEIKELTAADIRALPMDPKKVSGKCVKCGKPAKEDAHFARAY